MGIPPFTLIDMREARRLDGDVARLLHQRLSAWINAGEEKRATIETLLGYPAWKLNKNATTRSQRRLRVGAALDELRSIGWDIEESSRELFRVERPSSNLEAPAASGARAQARNATRGEATLGTPA